MKKSILCSAAFLFVLLSLLAVRVQAAENSYTEPSSLPITEENWTPFHYLNIITANSEYLSFDYKVVREGQEEDLCSITRSGDNTVAVFHATKMDGSKVKIRQIETGGNVFYVIDSEKKVFQFKAPATDILLYKMQEIVKKVPEKVFSKDDAIVYEFHEDFVQDETIKLTWHFFMKENRLVKLDYLFDGKLDTSYEFSDLSQDEPEAKLMVIPQNYAKKSYAYSYTGDNMPPWFE